MKKVRKDFGRLGIFNSVSLATRVRIEVLLPWQKKIQSNKRTATVLGYSSRPTLQVKNKGGQRRPLSLGFANALMRYGKMQKEIYLVSVYKKAETAFTGQLQPSFVVMHNLNKTGPGVWGVMGWEMGEKGKRERDAKSPPHYGSK